MAKKTNLKLTYEYDVDFESDTAPARVLRLVRPNSRVLEIGAGPGSITRHLVNRNKCEVVALEIDKDSVVRLKEFVDKVYDFDLNGKDWALKIAKLEGQFDYVIAADVLEHVVNPSAVLQGMKSLLNETGSVILSLPHVGHAAIGCCLLDEDFEYRDWGLLDKTHVRFFGMKNIQSLYAEQGMAIEQAEFVVRTPEMTEFVARWNRMPSEVKSALQRNRFSHVYQVVSRAVPSERSKVGLDLLTQEVQRPDEAIEKYWKGIMARIQSSTSRDVRSTMKTKSNPQGLLRRIFSGK